MTATAPNLVSVPVDDLLGTVKRCEATLTGLAGTLDVVIGSLDNDPLPDPEMRLEISALRLAREMRDAARDLASDRKWVQQAALVVMSDDDH